MSVSEAIVSTPAAASKPHTDDDEGDTFTESPAGPFSSISDTAGHQRGGTVSHELGSMRSASRFAGSSSGVYFLRTVCDAIAKVGTSENLSTSASSINLRFIPGEDERAADSTGCLWQATEINSSPDANWPTFEQLVDMVSRTYIQGWHCLLPFLQAEVLLEHLETACSRRSLHLESPESVWIRCVISIAVLEKRQMPSKEDDQLPPIPSCLVFRSLDDCISSIHPLLRDHSLVSLQGMLSAQLFMISIMELRSASRLGGWIVRMAYDIGLHRCPGRYRRSFRSDEIAIRRRVFWTMYSLDRYLCQALGLPLGIRDEDVDVCLPNLEVHWQAQEGSTSQTELRLIPLALLSKYSGIKGRLMEISNKCMQHRTSDEKALREVNIEILQWRNEVQDVTRAIFDDEGEDSEENSTDGSAPDTESTIPSAPHPPGIMTPAHRLLFQINYHELLLLMHRPALSARSTNANYPVAMLTCLSSARAIISSTKQFISRYKVSKGITEYPLLWHVILSTIWMSGLVIIFAAFERGITLDSANRDVKNVWSILGHLSSRLPGKPKACEAALRALFQLLCRKRGFSKVTNRVLMPERNPKRQKVSASSSRPIPSLAQSPIIPGSSFSPNGPISITSTVPGISINNNNSLQQTPESFQSPLITQQQQSQVGLGSATSPSQGSMDENQMLWLLDIPNLLDDQSLSFYAGGNSNPSLEIQADSEFNASDTLFRSLMMNMGNEDGTFASDNVEDTGSASGGFF